MAHTDRRTPFPPLRNHSEVTAATHGAMCDHDVAVTRAVRLSGAPPPPPPPPPAIASPPEVGV